MADAAFDYAGKHNLLRTSPIHGEQEAKLVLEDGFSYDYVEEEAVEQSSKMEVEETCQQ